MTPQDLANEVEAMIRLCTDRVGPDSIGARQYHVEGKPQKFETMAFDDLAEYYEEELRDIINYAVMTHIRLGRLRKAFARKTSPLSSPDLHSGLIEIFSANTTPYGAGNATCFDFDGVAAADQILQLLGYPAIERPRREVPPAEEGEMPW